MAPYYWTVKITAAELVEMSVYTMPVHLSSWHQHAPGERYSPGLVSSVYSSCLLAGDVVNILYCVWREHIESISRYISNAWSYKC